MSYIEDLTGLITPELTDLLYIYQNGADYHISNQQMLDLIKTNTVIPITQSDYDDLTPAEKNNGSIYIITDASITADDVTYDNTTSGLTATNVQDAIDEVKSDIPTNIPVIRSGTAQYTGLKGGYANRVTVPITFSSPMSNTNYNVFAAVADAYADFTDIVCYCLSASRTVNGCEITVIMKNSLTTDHSGYFYWTAIENQ